jgi:hypothetical protein
VAYELLTGSRPFQADSLPALTHMIVYADRPSARAANPELQPAVDLVLHRSLARLPSDRYPSCTEFVAALEESSKGAGRAQPNGEQPTRTLTGTSVPLFAGAGKGRPAGGFRNLLRAGVALLALLGGFILYKVRSPDLTPVVFAGGEIGMILELFADWAALG